MKNYPMVLSLILLSLFSCGKEDDKNNAQAPSYGNGPTLNTPPDLSPTPIPDSMLPGQLREETPEWLDIWAGIIPIPDSPNDYENSPVNFDHYGNEYQIDVVGCEHRLNVFLTDPNFDGFDPLSNPTITLKHTNNKKFSYSIKYLSYPILLDSDNNPILNEYNSPEKEWQETAKSGWSLMANVHQIPLMLNPNRVINLEGEVMDEAGGVKNFYCNDIFQKNTFPHLTNVFVSQGLEENGYDSATPTFTIKSPDGYFGLGYANLSSEYMNRECPYQISNDSTGTVKTITIAPGCLSTPGICTDNPDNYVCKDITHNTHNILKLYYTDRWHRGYKIDIPNFYVKE